MIKPKIFISCGQDKSSDEYKIAEIIKNKIDDTDKYIGYVATLEQSNKGLLNNILYELETAEYFIFIDFIREKLLDKNDNFIGYRGSLFTNQELSIASYFGIETIAFQEKGIKSYDGMIGAMQLNVQKHHVFEPNERNILPDKVIDEIQNRFTPLWKNKINLSDIKIVNNVKKYRIINFSQKEDFFANHYQIKVENLHKDKIALNCYAFIESILDLENNTPIQTQTVELKWAGVINIPNVSIINQSHRMLDAFFYDVAYPKKIYFCSYSDSDENLPPLESSNKYKICYMIVSSNFRIEKRNYIIEFINNIWQMNPE